MNFRHRRQETSSLRINITPLIDVVFLLLIFFMMTTTFNKEAELKIDLPEAQGDTPEHEIEVTRILIDPEGKYAINDWDHQLINTEIDTLKRALQQIIGEQKEPTILISADGEAPHQAVITAMEALRDLNYVRISFETQQLVDESQE